MKGDKYRSDAEAVPVFMQVKEAVWELYSSAVRTRSEYRVSHNPMDLVDFANLTIAMYDIVRTDILSDKRLKRNYGSLIEPLDKYGMDMPAPHLLNAGEWNKYFHDIHGVLYAMNILRITMDKDTDNDFAGVPGMEEVYENMVKNFGGFGNEKKTGAGKKETKTDTNTG